MPSIRVVVQQPALPKYRVPVFRALAAREGTDFRLLYGDVPELQNVAPDGFRATHVPARGVSVLGRRVEWHAAHGMAADARNADVAVMSWNLNVLSLLPALRKARKGNVGVVLWGHGYSKAPAAWRDALRNKATRLADALLFYDEVSAAKFRALNLVPPESVFAAPNTLDDEAIADAQTPWTPDALARFQQRHDLAGKRTIAFVSRVSEKSRLDLLLRAARALRGSRPDLRVVVIGGGEVERYQKLAAELGVADLARFAGAIYDEATVAPWMMSADVFCYPTSIGLSLLHAFNYGLPVVTSDDLSTQNPEIAAFRDGANGAFYKHLDADDLAAKLAAVLDDEGLRGRLSAEALRTARELFPMRAMVDGFERAIRHAFAQRNTV